MLGNTVNVPDAKKTTQGNESAAAVKIVMAAFVVITLTLLFEAGARVVYFYRGDIQGFPLISGMLQKTLSLDPYEMPSPNGFYHWVLRPGYDASMGQVVADKKKTGRNLGALALQSGNNKDRLRINADGFKGPELDKSHALPRILSLGDSVTFGLGGRDYPRRLEVALNGRGIAVESINGGVEGYSSRNILYEIERYKSLKPEVVTLFIGWNALFSSVPWPDAWENMFRGVWLFKSAARTLRAIIGDSRIRAEQLYLREPKPFPNTPDVQGLNAYTPPFLEKIEAIVDAFQSNGTDVVLLTLPGLFSTTVPASPRALKIGHLPYFTENPYVLAKLTERYNTTLRDLAVRRGLVIIDLDKWSNDVFQPRDHFFSDSVHLTAQALDMVGDFIADHLANRLLKNP